MSSQSRDNDVDHLQILTLNEALHGPFGFSPIFFWVLVQGKVAQYTSESWLLYTSLPLIM